jgi:hypothetical protein
MSKKPVNLAFITYSNAVDNRLKQIWPLQRSIGLGKNTWSHNKFQEIAKLKVSILWHSFSDGRIFPFRKFNQRRVYKHVSINKRGYSFRVLYLLYFFFLRNNRTFPS